MDFDDLVLSPEDAAADIPKLFEKERFESVHYLLDQIQERGGKQRAMELVEKHFRKEGKFDLAAQCLPWLLEKLKKDRDIDSEFGNKTPDEIRDYFGLGKRM